jgi:hypothetical protein
VLHPMIVQESSVLFDASHALMIPNIDHGFYQNPAHKLQPKGLRPPAAYATESHELLYFRGLPGERRPVIKRARLMIRRHEGAWPARIVQFISERCISGGCQLVTWALLRRSTRNRASYLETLQDSHRARPTPSHGAF